MSRTSRFAEFLKAAVAVRQKPVVLVDRYPSVLWWSGFPQGLKEVRSPLTSDTWPEDHPGWLVISRVQEPPRPAPPESCAQWLSAVELDVPLTPPEMNVVALVTADDGVETEMAPPMDVTEDWNSYLAKKWTPWSEKAAVVRQVKPTYQKLFALHQEMKGQSDTFDLFVGVGLYESKANPAQAVRRHLLAFPAEIVLDERSGTLTVTPSGEFVQAKPEVDFLDSAVRARIQTVVEGSRPALAEIGPVLQDRPGLGGILKDWAHSLDAQTAYYDELAAVGASAGGSAVSFAPALILRPRSLRSLDELLTKVVEQSRDDDEEQAGLSAPWRKMMETEPNTADWDIAGTDVGRPLPSRTYFPLPSNEEQAKIVRSAAGSAGVVVQGPPGTGKSHTIANLISHYLAEGRRVLVTAQTAQALHVLRDKLPMELQQLCVSMLGESRRNDKELERSVQTILSRRLASSSVEQDRQIATLDSALVEAETKAMMHERTLQQARARETEPLEAVPGYHGTRAAIARRVRDERHRLGVIQDAVPHDAECPRYPDGWSALAAYHRCLTESFKLELSLLAVEPPFTCDEAGEVVRRVVTARLVLQEIPVGALSAMLSGLADSDVEALGRWLAVLATADSQGGKSDGRWVADLRRELPSGSLFEWRSLLDEGLRFQSALNEQTVAAIVDVTVGGRSEQEARRDLIRLDDYFSAGGKSRMLLVLKPAVVKETDWLASSVQIDGKAVTSPEDVHRARVALDGWALIRRAEGLWPGVSAGVGSAQKRVSILSHRLRQLQSLLTLADSLATWPAQARDWLRGHLQADASTADLVREVHREQASRVLLAAEEQLGVCLGGLRLAIGQRHVVPALRNMVNALENALEPDLVASFSSLANDLEARARHEKYTSFLSALAARAPILAKVVAAAEGAAGSDHVFEELEAQWLHSRAASWLSLINSQEGVGAVERAAKAERRRAEDLVGQLAAAKAWRQALVRIDEHTRGFLVAWQQAVRNIPATGKSVFRKRATARGYLDKCLGAIPAWVVPLNRLYETVEPAPGLFDVAIVDEASQCWLDSLILFYLAKQVIVVGDDKQISPTVVGVGDGVIADLVRTYLHDFTFGRSFTITSSLFDHAQRYLSEGVPLREHFRSVPEIIRFSNELCYSNNPLIPLRQVGRDRLEPLKRTYLADGLRQNDVNDREARAIVEAIVACDADPSYEDLDFGVICLQGDAQADRIQHLLLERLGPMAFEKRGLRCGNPYAFQGDERDVIFLSMVAAPNWNNAPLTGSTYEQRFNVAMSRARDQAWLFHSIQENELGPTCLRRRVLEFFKQPPDLSIHGTAFDIPALQIAAQRADRTTERPPSPFGSWFEVDVALALVAKGYRLSAQVKVGTKFIDLVVEGDGARLAVECDGDHWHGPEHYAQDLFRQQQLERAEWRFARVRECLFYADEPQAIQEVIDACEELGIEAGWERKVESVESGPAVVVLEDDAVVDDEDLVDQTVVALDVHDDAAGDDEDDEETGPAPALFPDTRTSAFTGYSQKSYPDPRHATPATVREAVLDIVATDGPLPKASIYKLYRDGCPKVERASKMLRQQVNKAVYYLEKTGQIETRDEGASKDPTEVVVRLKTHEWVMQRSGGARTLDDVPLSELAQAMRTQWGDTRPIDEVDRRGRYKVLAGVYGVQRFTERAMERLKPAEEFAYRVTDEAAGPLFR